MKQKMLSVLLATGCIILIAASYILTTRRDKKAPEFEIEEMNISYTEGEDENKLLEGVTAKDDQDGDLTNQIFIEKILPIDDDYAIVFYAVIDKSNNIGTADRKINYQKKDTSSENIVSDVQEDISEEISQGVDQEKYGVPKPEGTPDISPDGKRPVMAMVTDEVKLKTGDTFDPVSVVWGIVDDKDDTDLLYQHIHIEGEYNLEVSGTYKIQYYVNDSDGNTSDPQVVTLTVE